MAARRRLARPRRRCNGLDEAKDTIMTPHVDDDTDLKRNFEPLRVALALGALLLGLVFGMH
jgi:hypothetical protein